MKIAPSRIVAVIALGLLVISCATGCISSSDSMRSCCSFVFPIWRGWVPRTPGINPRQERLQKENRLFQLDMSLKLSVAASSSTNSNFAIECRRSIPEMIETADPIPMRTLPLFLYFCTDPSHYSDGSFRTNECSNVSDLHKKYCPMFSVGLKRVFGNSLYPDGNGIISLSDDDFATNSLSVDGFSRVFIHEVTNSIVVEFEPGT